MKEGLIQGKEQAVDLHDLVNAVKVGEEDAQVALYGYLKSRFIPYFSQFFPEDAEDLTQISVFEVFNSLGRFEDKGKGSYSENFRNWTQGVARNIKTRYAWRLASHPNFLYSSFLTDDEEASILVNKAQIRQETERAKELSQPSNIRRLKRRVKERIGDILSESQKQVVELSLDGKTSDEIAAQLGISGTAVGLRLLRARNKIEKALLFPVGYKRISGIDDVNFRERVYRRHGGAVKFLGVLYMEEAELEKRLLTIGPKQRGEPDQSLLNSGYLLISKCLTQDEYEAIFKSGYSRLLVRRKGRAYIRETDLISFRRERQIGKPQETIISDDKYYALSDLAQTPAEYNRFYRAVQSSRLRVIRKGNKLLVTKQQIDELRKGEVSQEAQPSVGNETIIFSSV